MQDLSSKNMNSIWKSRHNAEARLTFEGWVYLVFLAFITIGSILRNVNLLVLMAGLMYAPLILQWRTCNQLMRKLKATRIVPQRIHAGTSVKMTWTVQNDSQQATAWNVLIADRIVRDDSLDGSSAEKSLTQRARLSLVRENEDLGKALKRALLHVWSWIENTDRWRGDHGIMMSIDQVESDQSRTGAWQVNFPVRGRYDIGPAQLSSTSALGLHACHLYLNTIQLCYVAPALGELNQGWVRQLKSMSPGSGTGMRRRGMDQEEFYALRPWRSGDSKKHIHWRTTARYGLPIVRQFDQNDDQDVAIVLDLYCPAAAEEHDESRIAKYRQDAETALSFATTVLSRAKVDVRGRITLGICGMQKNFFPGRQADFLASTMKALSIVQPGPRPPTIETLLDTANVISPGTPILVVSTRPEPDLVMLAASGQSSDSRVKEVSHDIVARRLQRIRSSVNWLTVDSETFQGLFSDGTPATFHKPDDRSNTMTNQEAQLSV